jgi:AcrR family transcriptional regulator
MAKRKRFVSYTLAAVPVLEEAPARGRPRSTAADESIRQAAIDLLSESGYDGLTMAGVAHAAGVSTATLYRRWRSKNDLVVGVLKEAADETPVPDTGSLEGDCRAVLRQLVANMSQPTTGPLLAGLISAMSHDRDLADAMRSNLIAPRRAAFRALLQRARARGEVAEGLDDDLVTDLFFGPVYQRLLVTGRPLTPRVADRLADLVVRAITPGAAQ